MIARWIVHNFLFIATEKSTLMKVKHVAVINDVNLPVSSIIGTVSTMYV